MYGYCVENRSFSDDRAATATRGVDEKSRNGISLPSFLSSFPVNGLISLRHQQVVETESQLDKVRDILQRMARRCVLVVDGKMCQWIMSLLHLPQNGHQQDPDSVYNIRGGLCDNCHCVRQILQKVNSVRDVECNWAFNNDSCCQKRGSKGETLASQMIP